MLQLIVDADACPVTELAVRAAARFGAPAVLVCDHSHALSIPGAQVITVSQGADSADYCISSLCRPGDVVVTQDYGLAALVLARGGFPISQDGLIYSDDNISALLESRHFAAKVRRSGGRLRGPKKRTRAQNEAFLASFEALLERLCRPPDKK